MNKFRVIDIDGVDLEETDFDNFIAHFGVKGMRWGVRRTDAQLGNPDGGKNGVKDKDGIDEDKSKMADSSPLKSRDPAGIDNPKDIVISEDAMRFVRTTLKEGHEMSDREIKEALQRAELVSKYNQKLNPDQYDIAIKQAAAAQARIDTLKAEREYLDLTTPPSKLERAKKLFETAEKAWDSYSSLNDTLGGILPDPLGAFKKAKQDADDLGITDTVKPGPSKREAKKQAKKEAKQAEAIRRERRDTQDMDYYRQIRKNQDSKAASTPSIPATQAAPSRPSTPFRLPPAPPTVTTPSTVRRPTSDRPYGGAYPNLGPSGTHVRHEDAKELIAKFSEIE